uniref:Uncharacterized protein n=1 Tax=Haptolina brevifila TaxID=156173 RepID=A0A7S2G4M6_9EUKA
MTASLRLTAQATQEGRSEAAAAKAPPRARCCSQIEKTRCLVSWCCCGPDSMTQEPETCTSNYVSNYISAAAYRPKAAPSTPMAWIDAGSMLLTGGCQRMPSGSMPRRSRRARTDYRPYPWGGIWPPYPCCGG